ncbi:ABC transporter permease subunit [Isoptericola sp. b490]|uniref:ABC transporter permease subunit n=1 Tax=Actinotalea lenta TaxID=3064654 RepID=UPI0027142987|nr:ABC transporter permease subunit [Isoptericola sp. b490]MDO8122221.1 ABC transporter permease subunit [Isoptericola sp. b490]
MIVQGVLRARRRGIGWWSVAVAGVAALYALFFPMMQTMDTDAMLASFPEAVVNALGWDALSSGAGYLHMTVFGLVGMAVLVACAVGAGARLIAGEEEAGLLELELAAPVSRTRVYLERLVVLLAAVALPVLATLVVLAVLDAVLAMEIPIGHLAGACLALWLFGVTIGAVSYAVGALTGRRGIALATGAGLAVLAYFASWAGPLADLDWLASISPYWWYAGHRPVVNGLDVSGMGLLVTLTGVAVATGFWGFLRRDTAT